MAATKRLAFHPAAEIFPLLEGKDFDELCASIKEHGQQVPIQMLGDKILDGRNRYLACREIKEEPWTVTAELGDLTPLQFVLALNNERRHMTPSQKAMVAGRAREMFDAEAKERMSKGGAKNGKTEGVENLPPLPKAKARDAAGEALSVSGRSVDHATKVLKEGTPEVAKAVDDGKVAVSKAAKIAAKPKAEQPAALAAEIEKKSKPKGKISGGATFDVAEIEAAAEADALPCPSLPEGIAKRAEPYKRAVADLNRIKRDMKAIAEDETLGAYLRDKITRIVRAIDEAKTPIAQACPTATCPKCGGKGCNNCSKMGWWPKSVVEGMK